jgi:hypothetical protein
MNQRPFGASAPHGHQHRIEHQLAMQGRVAAQPTMSRENRSMTTAT